MLRGAPSVRHAAVREGEVMSTVAAVTNVVNPVGDDSRVRRLAKVAGWIVAAAVVFGLLDAFGVDVVGWLSGLWDALRSVSVGYLVVAIALQAVGATFTALAWLFILRAGHPHAVVPFAPVLAAYAVGAALNAVLPAEIGSFVMLFMFIAIIPGSTFASVFAAFVVQKIFFTFMGALAYVYLFASVPGSFSVELGGLRRHPTMTVLIALGVAALVVFGGRLVWSRLHDAWIRAKRGGAILSQPRAYVVRVVLPSFAGYVARLAGIAVLLAAFAIPVTFNSVLHVVGGNSIANATAATPGGAGVNEAVSVVALREYADAQTATAFAVAQQFVGTSWNVIFAAILVLTVFGWSNGKGLVKTSLAEARERAGHKHGGDEAADAAIEPQAT
jgi:uncharacterized membrane protein YbhN (UPF0104 family)